MMADTKIDWADKSWNPIAGCTKCSPGCLNCYAEVMAKRLYWMGMEEPATRPEYMKFKDGWKDGHIELCEHRLDQPLHWRKPSRIFVCSMSDLFHEKVPFKFITRAHDRIDVCQQHTFIILTKRIVRAKDYYLDWLGGRIPENVHLGVSISTQAEADEKIPILLQVPAAVRYLSIEPMLEGIDISDYFGPYIGSETCHYGESHHKKECNCLFGGLSWIIVGCESGPGRRPCNFEWVGSIVEQCESANVPVFVKQINVNGKLVKMPENFPQEYPRT